MNNTIDKHTACNYAPTPEEIDALAYEYMNEYNVSYKRALRVARKKLGLPNINKQ